MVGTYQSPFGQIVFVTHDGCLTDMMFDDTPVIESHDALIGHIQHQLDLYFNHDLKSFNLPIQWNKGTVFQREVWDAMLEIPYGKVMSYSSIAEKIGHPKACRAVGQACKKNPIGIVVPCHRVIGKDGSLTGYSGKHHTDLKKQLLELESSSLKKGTS
jgi:O-6-methylguanine DNA methyltransferase